MPRGDIHVSARRFKAPNRREGRLCLVHQLPFHPCVYYSVTRLRTLGLRRPRSAVGYLHLSKEASQSAARCGRCRAAFQLASHLQRIARTGHVRLPRRIDSEDGAQWVPIPVNIPPPTGRQLQTAKQLRCGASFGRALRRSHAAFFYISDATVAARVVGQW